MNDNQAKDKISAEVIANIIYLAIWLWILQNCYHNNSIPQGAKNAFQAIIMTLIIIILMKLYFDFKRYYNERQ